MDGGEVLALVLAGAEGLGQLGRLGVDVPAARSLRRLPRHLVLVGVEAVAFEHGAPLSSGVAAGVPAAVRAVVDAVQVSPGEAPVAERGSAHVPG